jgi:hypothetical protein
MAIEWSGLGPELLLRLDRSGQRPAAALLTMIEPFLTAAPRDPALARMLRDRQDTTQRALRSRALT